MFKLIYIAMLCLICSACEVKVGDLTDPLRVEFEPTPNTKYLVVYFPQEGLRGLANRLKAINSGIVYSQITGRKLVLIWDKNADMVAGFEELFVNKIPQTTKKQLDIIALNNNLSVHEFNQGSLPPDTRGPSIIDVQEDILLVNTPFQK